MSFIRQQNQETNGTCTVCTESLGVRGLGLHLEKHLRERATGAPAFHLRVNGGRESYWMHVVVPASATLRDLDRLLRDTWLECCGHLSAFTVEGSTYDIHGEPSFPLTMIGGGSLGMDETLGAVLEPGFTFVHEYDFGTTTTLYLCVFSSGAYGQKGNEVELLIRNDPPDTRCEICGAKAAVVCSFCQESNTAWFCDVCAGEHAKGECGEDAFLPVVNSPRVGQCAYRG